jgi:MFS family permease
MTTTHTKRALRRLLHVDPPPAARSALEITVEVEHNYRWNFVFNLLDGAAFWLGLSFMSTATILPLYVSKLTPSPLAIGLIAVIANSGWFLPQLFTANTVQRLPRRKPVVVNLGFFTERLPLWLLPLSALLAVRAPAVALFLFFLGFASHALGAGVVATAWQDLIARIIPVDRRGRFFGITTFVGNGTGALGAIFSAWLLATLVFPTNFVATFALAALFITLSWAALAQAREPEQRVTAPRQNSRQYWAGLPRILAEDHNFRRYINARLLMVLGGMGAGFLTVAVVSRWQVSDGAVGLYTLALLIGQTLGNAGAGFLADQRGHKLPLELGSLLMVIAYLLAWLAPGPAWYYAVFLALGIAIGAVVVSGMMIVLEFSPDELRPTYAGLSNTAMGLLGMVSPLIGAWLASRSYDWLFALSALFWLAGLVSLRFWVCEPRWSDAERLDQTPAAAKETAEVADARAEQRS